MSHTPGQWEVGDHVFHPYIPMRIGRVIETNGFDVRVRWNRDFTQWIKAHWLRPAIAKAEGKVGESEMPTITRCLMAASPEMYRALTEIVDCCEERKTLPGSEDLKRWCDATIKIARAAIAKAEGKP